VGKKAKLTELKELGEFGLIERLTGKLKVVNTSTLKGVGDDAAVIKYDDGLATLISNDMLVEGVHFDLTYTPLKHLGYKAATTNFSDMAAMNARPKQLLVGLAVSSRYTVEALEEFYDGIKLACSKYQVDLVGGDTTSSISGMIISVSVIGEAAADEIVYRHTAGENDLICVSGELGGAYMGLLLLEREKAVFRANPDMQPELSGHEYILQRQLKPEARTDIISLLKSLDIKPTAMIDISDGLASELFHICKASQKGCNIYEEKIPLHTATKLMAEEFHLEALVCALSGGEDYELLFSIRQSDYDKIKEQTGIHIIGHITDKNEGINLVSRNNTLIPLSAQGWDAFK